MSASFIPTISLITPSICTSTVLDLSIPDIIKGSTEGFECHDAEGHNVQVFIEVCGYIADYSGSSWAVDVMKPSAGSPCPRRTF